MALPAHALKLIEPYCRNARVLCLGYPDILAPAEFIRKTFSVEVEHFTDRGSRHNVDFKLPESYHFFKLLNSELTCVDFVRENGKERIANLNYPHDFGRFDLVIDPGTLEHCFNIGTAWENAFDSVKVGGRILHLSPMTMLNHGFFNFNPTLFNDFYKQNGWEVEMTVVPNNQIYCDPVKRFTANIEFLIRALAKRVKDGKMIYPLQTKYLEMIERKAA